MKITELIYLKNIDIANKKIPEFTWDRIKVLTDDSGLPISNMNKIKKEFKKEYIPVKGDKLWFYPGCKIPRFKVKQFCQKYGVSVVKDKTKATIKVVGNGTYDMLLEKRWNETCVKESFAALEKIAEISTTAKFLFAEITADPESYVIFPRYLLYRLSDTKPYSDLKKTLTENSLTDYLYIASDKTLDSLVLLLNDSTAYHEDSITVHLNTGTVMTKDMYENARKMLESHDPGNRAIALEAMANCDFQQSAVYLLWLLSDFRKEIWNCSVRTHVNFKSLLNFFDIKSKWDTFCTDNIIEKLGRQKLLSTANVNLILSRAMEEIRESGELIHIKIKEIEFTPDFEKMILENILDKTNAEELQPTSEEELC